MAKILLDYVFPIQVINPIPGASTAFLRKACLVVKPKLGVDAGLMTLCTNITQVLDLTDNENASRLLEGGLTSFYILTANDLDLVDYLEANKGIFYTVLISDDFIDDDITNLVTTYKKKASLVDDELTFTAKDFGVSGNLISIECKTGGTAGAEVVTVLGPVIEIEIEDGVSTNQEIINALLADEDAMDLVDVSCLEADLSNAHNVHAASFLTGGLDQVLSSGGLDVSGFPGVVGLSVIDPSLAIAQALIENRCCFLKSENNKADNLCFAFGSLLSGVSWSNQQYIAMPLSDSIDNLGDANNLFDSKVSFVITDEEYGNRLALMACGKKAIVAPYIIKDLCINLQSAALIWINNNQPDYTIKEASLLEERLQEDVIEDFIDRKLITLGTLEILLEDENFTASGYINVSEPKALWRVISQLKQTL